VFRSADFELFRPESNAALDYSDQTEGGRAPFDRVLMSKIIQPTNNLSDDALSSLLMTDCRSCGPLGLGLEGRVQSASSDKMAMEFW
jgi:transposase, IS5 family